MSTKYSLTDLSSIGLAFLMLFLGISIKGLAAPGKKYGEKVRSKQVFLGAKGKLEYAKDKLGNRLPDFSYVGYHSGEKAIPDVPVKITLKPEEGDDTARIQKALDTVGEMPLSEQGHRGAVLLQKGTYRVNGTLNLLRSGVVLRGEGDGPDETLIIATGYDNSKYRRSLITVGDSKKVIKDEASKQGIVTPYVPIGAHRFEVASAKDYSVGDRILVYRPSTKEWISSLGMDSLPARYLPVWDTEWRKEGPKPGFYYMRKGLQERRFSAKKPNETWEEFQSRIPLDKDGKQYNVTRQWQPGEYDFYFERSIVAIDKNSITIDAPIVHSMEARFGGGFIFKYTAPTRIREVGIEDLRLFSEFSKPVKGHPYGHPKKTESAEDHAWTCIRLNKNSENVWVRRITGNYFGFSLVELKGTKATVTDCVNLGHASMIKGGRRYPFTITGQRNLVQRCLAREARHDFALGQKVPGPNVFVDCIGFGSTSSVGPHHRYAIGQLFDNVSNEFIMESRNRKQSGSGHGWAGAQTCYYNCQARGFVVEAPPGGKAWVLGSSKHTKFRIRNPKSLYYQQVLDRLGESALKRLVSTEQLNAIGTHAWAKGRLQEAGVKR